MFGSTSSDEEIHNRDLNTDISKDSNIDCNDDSDIDLIKLKVKAQTKMLGLKARMNKLGGENV